MRAGRANACFSSVIWRIPAVPKEAVALAVERFGGVDTLLITAALMVSSALEDWTNEMWTAR